MARVAKSQLLRQALSERMCDIVIQQPAPDHAAARGWQPVYAPPGGVITPPVARLFLRWDTMGYGDHLLMIKAFAKTCISASAADTSAFSHTARGWKANRLGKSFLEVAPLIEFWSRTRHEDARFDPQVQLAVDVFQQVGLLEGTAMGSVGQVERWFAQGYAAASVAVRVNAFVDELGKCGRQVSIVQKLQRHEDVRAARGREVRTYLTGVLKHHPRSDVMRFELCMSRSTKLNRQDEYDFMLEASARYLRELKKVFGAAIVGDIRKIDRGTTSLYLVHVLIAVDGPKQQELAAIRQVLSDHWDAQTQGLGCLIDCSAVDVFMYRGAGVQFGRYDSTTSQLNRAAIFLADTDRLIQVGYGGVRDGLVLGTVSGPRLP